MGLWFCGVLVGVASLVGAKDVEEVKHAMGGCMESLGCLGSETCDGRLHKLQHSL